MMVSQSRHHARKEEGEKEKKGEEMDGKRYNNKQCNNINDTTRQRNRQEFRASSLQRTTIKAINKKSK